MNAQKSVHSRYHKAPLRGARLRYRAALCAAVKGGRDNQPGTISKIEVCFELLRMVKTRDFCYNMSSYCMLYMHMHISHSLHSRGLTRRCDVGTQAECGQPRAQACIAFRSMGNEV